MTIRRALLITLFVVSIAPAAHAQSSESSQETEPARVVGRCGDAPHAGDGCSNHLHTAGGAVLALGVVGLVGGAVVAVAGLFVDVFYAGLVLGAAADGYSSGAVSSPGNDLLIGGGLIACASLASIIAGASMLSVPSPTRTPSEARRRPSSWLHLGRIDISPRNGGAVLSLTARF